MGHLTGKRSNILFTYGTLRDPRQLRRICGEYPRLSFPAFVKGFRNILPKGIPMLDVAEECEVVIGVCHVGLSDSAMKRLDVYENVPMYKRISTSIYSRMSPINGWLYVKGDVYADTIERLEIVK